MGQAEPEFWGSTYFTPISYITKEIFTATSPLHKQHPLTPTFSPFHCTQLPGSLQSLVISRPRPAVSFTLELTWDPSSSWCWAPAGPTRSMLSCGPVLSPISLDVPLGCPSGVGWGCQPSAFRFLNFQNFNLEFLESKTYVFFIHIYVSMCFIEVYVFL